MFAILVAVGDVFPSREHKQLREAHKLLLGSSGGEVLRNVSLGKHLLMAESLGSLQ